MKKIIATLGLLGTVAAGTAVANEGPSPAGINRLDHVFVIMMENHGYGEIMNNPNAPFINQLATTANLATNYYGVAHPSLTNYLEVVGGSNFSVLNDFNPDWHNKNCVTNLASGVVSNESSSANICPITGFGTDAATPAVDYSNETSDPAGENNIDGVKAIPAKKAISGKTIADQLVAEGLSWKSYQESIGLQGADGINSSDGFFNNKSDFSSLNPPISAGVVALYAAKHNPFVYFKSVQEGKNPKLSLNQVVDFDGQSGLYEDLGTGKVPTFSFIAPNQCNDMHGKSGSGASCAYDPSNNGTQTGLNPGLIKRGDETVQRLVTAIKGSPVWNKGNNAIVVLWDENDYSVAPITNQVPAIVVTNHGMAQGVQSGTYYNHFSLLKSIESALGLPCLNHACDADVQVMSDLFN